MRIVPFLFYF